MMTAIDPRLSGKRTQISQKIARNPFVPESMQQQFYKKTKQGGEDPDGDPIDIPVFPKPVRIFNNAKAASDEMSAGVPVIDTNKYIMAEYDQVVSYGMQFEYFGRKYKIMDPVDEIRFGGVVCIRAELRDITRGTKHAN